MQMGNISTLPSLPLVESRSYLNLAVLDIRDGKREFDGSLSLYLNRFIKRSNLFCHLFGRGKNFTLLKGIAKEENLTLHMPIIYAKQR